MHHWKTQKKNPYHISYVLKVFEKGSSTRLKQVDILIAATEKRFILLLFWFYPN